MIFSFLDNLYKESWFLPALIGTIIFLVILFFIILIMAIKDAKKNSKIKEFTQENDMADAKAEVAFKDVEPQPIEVKITPNSTILEHDINEEHIHKDEDLSSRFNSEFSMSPETSTDSVVVTDNLINNDEMSAINSFNDIKVVQNDVNNEVSNDQFSSVFVTPDTLPSKKANDFDLNDIPAPQPVRVVNSSTVIDSSNKIPEKKELDDIAGEVYNIKK